MRKIGGTGGREEKSTNGAQTYSHKNQCTRFTNLGFLEGHPHFQTPPPLKSTNCLGEKKHTF